MFNESTGYCHSVKPATRPTSARRLVEPTRRIAPLDGVAAPVEAAGSEAKSVAEADGPAVPLAGGELPIALA